MHGEVHMHALPYHRHTYPAEAVRSLGECEERVPSIGLAAADAVYGGIDAQIEGWIVLDYFGKKFVRKVGEGGHVEGRLPACVCCCFPRR